MSYALALEDDFDSDGLSEIPFATAELPPEEHNKPTTLEELLKAALPTAVSDKLEQIDTREPHDVASLVLVPVLIPTIREELATHASRLDADYMELMAAMTPTGHSAEYAFLVQLNQLPVVINDEIALLHRYVAGHYRVVFPELENIVASPVDYCRVVAEIGQELVGIRAHEHNLRQIVSPDKVLTIVMAALEQYQRLFELSAHDMAHVLRACQTAVELQAFLGEVLLYILAKLARFAPNVAVLIGPVATSQLIFSTGSLALLASTPACNLASFGVKDLLSAQKSHSGVVRATGYLYHCPLVKGLPPEIVKQALRIISGKVVLAARIDLSKSSPDGAMGEKFRQDVQLKIDKLLTPPDQVAVKALPVPKEQKLKKRGGRRFRKMKERFQMSDLRKAQNRMQFGAEEQSLVDGFGEEIGLGMSKNLDGVQVNRNTDARMSKAMVSRLQQQKERSALETLVFGNVTYEDESVGTKRPADPEWGTMKKQKR